MMSAQYRSSSTIFCNPRIWPSIRRSRFRLEALISGSTAAAFPPFVGVPAQAVDEWGLPSLVSSNCPNSKIYPLSLFVKLSAKGIVCSEVADGRNQSCQPQRCAYRGLSFACRQFTGDHDFPLLLKTCMRRR